MYHPSSPPATIHSLSMSSMQHYKRLDFFKYVRGFCCLNYFFVGYLNDFDKDFLSIVADEEDSLFLNDFAKTNDIIISIIIQDNSLGNYALTGF